MKPIKLVLADDQVLIRESIAFVLDTDDMLEVVGIAQDGEAALRLCEEMQPDIVLMDIQMPVMNGIDATREIKRRWPQMKVIMLTTFQEVDHVVAALSIGAEGYLLKAIHPKELISGIKHIHNDGTLLSQHLALALAEQALQAKPAKQAKQRYGITEREEQVLMALTKGLSNRQISELLFLSEGTVKNYISSLYHKLNVKDRSEAVSKAKDERMV